MIVKVDLREIKAHEELAFRRASDEAVGEAKDHAPVSVSRGLKLNAGEAQGGLRASLTAEGPERRPDGLYGRIGSPLRYAMQREKGGPIIPRRGRFLVWRDPVTGELIFAKRVMQRPGGPRQGYKPFIGPAGDKWPGFFHDHLRAMP